MAVVKNRALCLCTRGLLGGSLLAIATHGLLQVKQEVEVPVQPPAVSAGGGSGSTYISYREVPEHYTFTSRFKLIIDPASLVRLSHRPPPPKIEKPTLLSGHFISRDWTLTLVAASQARYFDAGQDEEDLILLLALHWIQSDDEDGGYFS